MNTTDNDPLVRDLAGLATAAPAGLARRLFTEWVQVPGPAGDVFVAFTSRGIRHVLPAEAAGDDPARFAAEFHARFAEPLRAGTRAPAGLAAALRTGRARSLAFDLRGQSEFEQAVLRKALEIPRGETRPYGWIAREIGRPGAVRATGTALGRNPVPVLIPCHRVVRSDGDPGDYAFGRALKHRLLTAEAVNLDEVRRLAAAGARLAGCTTTGIVCYPTCHHLRRAAPERRVPFRSLAAAEAAGYRPCRHCRPAAA